MEFVNIPQEAVRTLGTEYKALGMVNGVLVSVPSIMNVDTPQPDKTAIIDPDNAKLSTAEIAAKIQALEAQIGDLRADDDRLQLERSTALKNAQDTSKISIQQFDIRQNVSAIQATLEGLKLATVAARQRESVAAFEAVTADLLSRQNSEQNAFNKLQKAMADYQAVASTINSLRTSYEAKWQDLRASFHIAPDELKKRRQATLMDEFFATVDSHREIVKPSRAGFPFSGQPLAITDAKGGAPIEVDQNVIPTTIQRPPMVQPVYAVVKDADKMTREEF